LTFAATEAHHSPLIAALALAAAVAGFVLFLRSERESGPDALIPLDMFRLPEFRSAVIATGAMTFGMYGALFLVPLTWQETGRLHVAQAGLALMPMALVFVLVSPFSGAVAARVGQRVATCGGVAVIGSGLLLLAATASWSSIVPTEAGLALTGLGMGFATGPLMGAAVNAVSAERSGIASALINVARMVGATMGVAVLGAVFALENGGAEGLRAAMLLGGLFQICAAALAGFTARSKRIPAACDGGGRKRAAETSGADGDVVPDRCGRP
jgi:predicted MFS family arabinose efflux permease